MASQSTEIAALKAALDLQKRRGSGIPAGDVTDIDVLTQAEYDALPVKVATTLYVIQG